MKILKRQLHIDINTRFSLCVMVVEAVSIFSSLKFLFSVWWCTAWLFGRYQGSVRSRFPPIGIKYLDLIHDWICCMPHPAEPVLILRARFPTVRKAWLFGQNFKSNLDCFLMPQKLHRASYISRSFEIRGIHLHFWRAELQFLEVNEVKFQPLFCKYTPNIHSQFICNVQ